MNKYKFNIGDKVIINANVTFLGRPYIPQASFKKMIVTGRTKSQSGNQYSCYIVEDDNEMAWFFEDTMEKYKEDDTNG